jgi:feruloyl esterase
MVVMLARGYAVASTDTGHQSNGGDASWALRHPEKQIDFGYRAVHEMTVRAKAIVEAFYAARPRFSYWTGCSSGGKQGLKEAQRFPDDYDGIIAGAPANYWTHLMTQILWVAHAARKDPESVIPQSKYPAINAAVMAACDSRDGVKDGVLEDPRRCQFKPASLQCKGPDGPDCLTGAQVSALEKVYAPARNPRTGEEIFPGLPVGSELGWAQLPQPFLIAESHYKYIVHGDAAWDYRTLDFDKDLAKADAIDAALGQFTANDPDLLAFRKRGGKLIQYHGWNDQQISAQNSVNYYERVVARIGSARETEDFYRLFMAPGVNHCQGGQGPDTFDMVTALEQWVEQGKGPTRIVASHATDGKVDRTRPLCPYPQVAIYSGQGSTDEAANFVCRVP